MHFSLATLANKIGAQYSGDGTCIISSIAPLDTAQAGQISFLANPRYRKLLAYTQASAVILSPADSSSCPVSTLILDNPYLGYAKAAELFYQPSLPTPGIHPTAIIGARSTIHPSASIGPYCVIGEDGHIDANVVISAGFQIGNQSCIGKDSILWARVTLYSEVLLGQKVIIHSGAILGGDGFGFANEKGCWYKIPQLGRVIIGDNVEIGANSTIDRGALGDTVLEEGVKLDNQIQIGHNVHIGAHTIIAGCVGIAGSTTISKHCRIGGAACVGSHLTIVDQVAITGATIVMQSITKPGIYSSGTSAQENRAWHKSAVRFYQLDDMYLRLKKLEQQNKRESS